MTNRTFPRHAESVVAVEAPPEQLFELLDDHSRLSAHMTRRSWMMGGGRMVTATDERHGREVGSHIVIAGRVFGVRLALDEVVVERERARRKVWETVGDPRLLVIGSYRMGFEIDADGPRSRLRVFIEYALPQHGVSRLLGRLLGSWYARWCTRRMTADAVRMFGPRSTRAEWHGASVFGG